MFKIVNISKESLCFVILLCVCTPFVLIYYTFYSSSNKWPTHPIWGQSGIIRDSKSASDGLLLESCQVFKNKSVEKEFPGKYCKVLPEGQLITFVEDHLMMLDSELSVLWKKKLYAHHDVSVDIENKEIAFLSHHFNKQKVSIHSVKIVNFQGEELFHWDTESELENILSMSPVRVKIRLNRGLRSLLKQSSALEKSHAPMKLNSVHLIQKTNLYPKYSFLKPGNLLVNIQLARLIVIIDRATEKIVWSYSPDRPAHSAKLKDDGTLIYFQNKASKRERGLYSKIKKYIAYFPRTYIKGGRVMVKANNEREHDYSVSHSSVKEYDIEKDQIVWEYSAPYRFFSNINGYISLLENGNVLISHNTNGGAIMEVNRRKEIVWEWISPDRYSLLGFPKNVYNADKVKEELVRPFLENDF